MKLKQEFVLRQVAGENLLIPVAGLNDTFRGIITLNETGTFIWKQMESGKEEPEIVEALLEEYEVSAEQAAKNVADFCENFRRLDIL